MDIDDDEKSWHPKSATPSSEEFISDHEESEEEEALEPEYEHTCKCSDGCHTWHKLEGRERRIWNRRHGARQVFLHGQKLQPHQLNLKAKPARRDLTTFSDMVEKIFTPRLILKAIKGTNQHGASDRNYKPIKYTAGGIWEMKMFICCLIKLGFTKGTSRSMWSEDLTLNSQDVTPYMTRNRFEMINRHFCFNPWEKKDPKPFKKFWEGISDLRQNSNDLIICLDVYCIDELRVKATSKKDRFKTWNKGKPCRLGRDLYTVCVASQQFHGFSVTSIPFQAEHTHDFDVAVTEDEGKQDNVVNQLIRVTTEHEDEIYVMDRGFTSVYVATAVANRHHGVGIVGTIKSDRKCLPKAVWQDEEWKEDFKLW